MLARANGWVARPKFFRFSNQLYLCGASHEVTQVETLREPIERASIRHPFHLHPIRLWEFVRGIGDAVLKAAVIG